MSYLATLYRQGATGVEVDATQGNISITFHQTPPVEPMRIIDGNPENRQIKLVRNVKLRIERELPRQSADL